MEQLYKVPDEDWVIVKHEVRDILIQLAKEKRTTTYGELCRKLISIRNLHPRSSDLHSILYQISLEEHKRGRGILSALVVKQDTGLVGKGFYDMARNDLKLDVLDKESFWIKSVKEIFDYWERNID